MSKRGDRLGHHRALCIAQVGRSPPGRRQLITMNGTENASRVLVGFGC
jgi:hypothetical protein